MKGIDDTTSTKACDIEVIDPQNKKVLHMMEGAITYKKSVTGELTAIEPKVGLKKGSTEIKVKGKGFGTTNADVKVFVGDI